MEFIGHQTAERKPQRKKSRAWSEHQTVRGKRSDETSGKKSNQDANGKGSGAKFPSKTIKHDPQAESARAVSGLKDTLPEHKD
jgi:hypothetical protein